LKSFKEEGTFFNLCNKEVINMAAKTPKLPTIKLPKQKNKAEALAKNIAKNVVEMVVYGTQTSKRGAHYKYK